MNYNNDFNFSDLIYDKKYKSRLILAIYFILFVVLIFFVRTTNDKSNELSNNENVNSNDNIVNNNIVDNNNIDDEEPKDEIDIKFSYILQDNYNFEYSIDYNNTSYVASGKRFGNKQEFLFGNDEARLKYLVDGSLVKAKVANDEEDFSNAQLPYFYINYYNSSILKEIIKKSTMIDENIYEISNKDLYQFIESEFKKEIDITDEKNKIYLTLKNNNITEINLDITNLVKNIENEEVFSAKISLKYKDFGLVDNFEINFL